MNQIEKAVRETIVEIWEQRSRPVREIAPTQLLIQDLGLESMDIAQLVATLEMKLSVDPFAKDVSIASVRTVAELCAAYAGRV